jgi:hypothetical protein
LAKESTTSPMVISVDSYPYGLSYSAWTARWWQWVLSVPLERNPLKDDRNRYYALNQSGPVWFLAGAEQGRVHRKCTIPQNKAILIPILNYGTTLADEPALKSEEELVLLANREMDVISNLKVSLDQIELTDLQKFRVASPVFDVVLPNNSLFGGTAGPTKGAADGYWLFLKPLSPGIHTIESFGSCQAGKVSIGVSYEMIISKQGIT